jgi:phospholipid/cholesterol/gamma-HCH transport system substrate-binding protein
METRINYVMVGSFALALVAGLIMFVLWASGARDGHDFTRYQIYFNQAVNGLTQGSQVRFMGVQVGQVEVIELDMSLQEPRVKAVVKINETVPVSTATVAALKPSGITGMYFIDLRNEDGKASRNLPISRDDMPVIRAEQSDFDKLFGGAGNTMQRIDMVLARVEKLLSDENIDAISATFKHLEGFTAALDDSGEGDTGNFIRQSTAAAKELNRLLKGLNDEGFHEQLSALVGSMQSTVNSMDSLAESIERNPSQILFPPKKQGVKIQP